jgi:hypothetical protein
MQTNKRVYREVALNETSNQLRFATLYIDGIRIEMVRPAIRQTSSFKGNQPARNLDPIRVTIRVVVNENSSTRDTALGEYLAIKTHVFS